jgi:hypothetical protein
VDPEVDGRRADLGREKESDGLAGLGAGEDEGARDGDGGPVVTLVPARTTDEVELERCNSTLRGREGLLKIEERVDERCR